jgi:hypothetical protein
MDTTFEDKTLPCKQCGGNFLLPAGEQQYMAEKGFNMPTRCKPCRQKNKAAKAAENPQAPTPHGPGDVPRNTRPVVIDQPEQLRASGGGGGRGNRGSRRRHDQQYNDD